MIAKTRTQTTQLLLSVIIPFIILLIPTELIPIKNFTIIEHRMLAIFFMACLFWILEPIPVFATSVLIIVLELIFLSDKNLIIFRNTIDESGNFGTLLNYKEIMNSFASPIIMLFLGGFFLAMAATKYRLDTNLARVLTKPFGTKPQFVMLGLMIITAVFSMFMSNTATTAMMLTILTPVLILIDKNDKGKAAFILAIPFAANIGGIATPIGTPPNAIAMKYLTGSNYISFGKWMSFGIPFAVVMLLFIWILLISLFPIKTKEIKINIKGEFLKTRKAIIVYITFVSTILLWLSDSMHGMNAYIVAMIPVAVFTTTGIITAKDLKSISWDVLWLVAGGIALGTGLEKTGLTVNLIKSIPFTEMSPFIIVLFSTIITIFMATLMSNTATANLLLPIMAALGANLSTLIPIGGSKMVILAVTLSCSLGMSMPISTPPNAMAYASGIVDTRQMAKAGIIIGIIGLLCLYLLLYTLNAVNFL